MTSPDAQPGYLALIPPDHDWPNRFLPRGTMTLGFQRPYAKAKHVTAPLLVQVMSDDVVTPPKPARIAAEAAPRGELIEYPGGHFDIYVGDTFERAVTDQIEFLGRVLYLMRIVHVLGTRPNFVKMAPVIAASRERFGPEGSVIVHTGQHYDRAMSDIFFEELGVPEPEHMLGVGSGAHGVQTAKVIERLEPVLRAERPDLVLVPGDVNSTLAAALCAQRCGITVCCQAPVRIASVTRARLGDDLEDRHHREHQDADPKQRSAAGPRSCSLAPAIIRTIAPSDRPKASAGARSAEIGKAVLSVEDVAAPADDRRNTIETAARIACAALPPPGARSKISASSRMIAMLRAVLTLKGYPGATGGPPGSLSGHDDDREHDRRKRRERTENRQRAEGDRLERASLAARVGEANGAQDRQRDDDRRADAGDERRGDRLEERIGVDDRRSCRRGHRGAVAVRRRNRSPERAARSAETRITPTPPGIGRPPDRRPPQSSPPPAASAARRRRCSRRLPSGPPRAACPRPRPSRPRRSPGSSQRIAEVRGRENHGRAGTLRREPWAASILMILVPIVLMIRQPPV